MAPERATIREPSARAVALARRTRNALAGAFVLYAVVNLAGLFDYSTYYRGSGWEIGAALAFLVLATALFAPSLRLRAVAAYVGILLIAQALLTPLARPFDYRTLPPNLVEVIDVQGDGIPGIQGVQRITTDAQGYRSAKPVDYDHPAGLRIFTIGGSTTEDINLDDQRTWTALLGRRLEADLGRPVETINTGLSGLRSPNHLATLEHVSALHPDAVIFLLGANDWNTHVYRAVARGVDTAREPAWLLDAQRRLRSISLRESLLATTLRALVRGWRGSSGGTDAAPRIERGEKLAERNHSLERARVVEFRPDAVDPLYDRYLGRIFASCRARGLLCIFATQPSGYSASASPEYRKSFWMTPAFADYTLDLASLEHIATLYNRHLIEAGTAQGFPVCDVASRFEASHRYFYDDLHLNAAGAEHMAQSLAACVEAALRRKPR